VPPSGDINLLSLLRFLRPLVYQKFHNISFPICKCEDKRILHHFDGKKDEMFFILTGSSSLLLAYEILYLSKFSLQVVTGGSKIHDIGIF
jgi:hypothetical protein